MNATPERCVPHAQAYPLDARKQHMRWFIGERAKSDFMPRPDATAVAATYGPCGQIHAHEVEAEILKYPTEECGK